MQITLNVVKFNSQITALIDLRCLGLELVPLATQTHANRIARLNWSLIFNCHDSGCVLFFLFF